MKGKKMRAYKPFDRRIKGVRPQPPPFDGDFHEKFQQFLQWVEDNFGTFGNFQRRLRRFP